MFDPRTHHEEDMPLVDDDGRKIVRVVADNDAGWRYTYEDQMIFNGDKAFKGKIKPTSVTVDEGQPGNLTGNLSGNLSGNGTGNGWGEQS